MSADHTAAFVANAEDHHATVRRVAPAEATEAVADLLEPPAVGIPLPPKWNLELPGAVETAPTPADLEDANTGVTAAGLGIADYGSLVLESDAAGTEAVSLFPERHVAVLREADVVPGMGEAVPRLGEHLRNRGSAVIATGPSATADMGELVIGAHGPREVGVVLVSEDGGDRR